MNDKEEKQVNFWKTPRGKAVKKLGLWAIFFTIVFLILALEQPVDNYEKQENENQEVIRFLLYDDMLKELENNNYAFYYDITIDDLNEEYIYEGQKDGQNTLGIKESSNSNLVKYFINEEGTYEVKMQNLVPLDNLYENVDANVFDLTEFFNSIKTLKYEVEKSENTRKIKYSDIDFELTVKTDLKHITNIHYKIGHISYEITLSQIGEIQNLSYN